MTIPSIVPFNDDKEFDLKIKKKLKSYVYALRDPLRGGEIFYVGKGGGDEGNNRVLAHFEEARNFLRQWTSSERPDLKEWPEGKEKIKRICEIWKSRNRVDWSVLHYGLDEQQAFAAEAAVINALGLDRLANEQGGHGAQGNTEVARDVTSDEIYRWGAKPVNPENSYPRVLIFKIYRALANQSQSCEPHLRAYEAVRQSWVIGEAWRRQSGGEPTIAIGLASDNVSTVVVKVDAERWQPRDGGKKWAFEGAVLTDHELLGKNFAEILSGAEGYTRRGGWIAVEFGGAADGPYKRKYRIVRGRVAEAGHDGWRLLVGDDAVG